MVMEISIGQYNTLEVVREGDPGLYLGAEAQAVLLPWRYVPEGTKVGDQLRVFVYTDSEDRPIATTLTPTAVVGDFALLEVVAVAEHGAFLNWGLAKDLFAPFNEQRDRTEVGGKYVFAVSLDERDGRVKASSELGRYFDYDVDEVQEGDEVDLLVYGRNDVGALVVVDGRHAGIVYLNETFQPLTVGDEITGYVKFVRPDNKLDIRLQRIGAEAADDGQRVVLEALRAHGGFLPLHDKSPPEEIRAQFALSKKAFKRALGALYKARRVELRPDGVKLLD
jgi:predicted RNA-binding protein (virulence factor B family)